MCSLGEHTSRAPSGIRPAATCFAPNAGPPLWFANLLLIPQSTENFSPPELNGKLLLLLRSSRKPRAASKVAPSASPRKRIKRKDPPGVRVTDGTFLFSPLLLGPQRHSTQRHTSGSALEMMNEPLPPLQRGEPPTAWWVGGGTAAAAHSIMQRNPKRMGEQWKRHTEKSPPGMPPPPRPPQPPLVAEEATTSVCACVCVCDCRERERHRSLLSVRARDLPPPLFSSSESKQQQQQHSSRNK